jgi:hypothetical protein
MAPQSFEPTFFLLKRRLPPSESANLLGRVIRRYQDPTLDYTPESPSQTLSGVESGFSQYLVGVQYDDSARFVAQGIHGRTRWVGFLGVLSSSTATGGSTTVTSPRIITRRLKLEGEYFNALKSVPAIRRKMLDMCPVNDKVYLVVGTMSAQTATFNRTASQSRVKTISASLPLGFATGAAAMSVGVPLPPGAETLVPDAEAGVAREDAFAWAASFSTGAVADDGSPLEDGEEVFAVACKVITRSWKALGKDVKVRAAQPEYRGGQHFGEGEDGSDPDDGSGDEAGADEQTEAAIAQGLALTDDGPGGAEAEISSIFRLENVWAAEEV